MFIHVLKYRLGVWWSKIESATCPRWTGLDSDWGEAAKMVGAIFKSCEGTWRQVRCYT